MELENKFEVVTISEIARLAGVTAITARRRAAARGIVFDGLLHSASDTVSVYLKSRVPEIFELITKPT